MEADYHEIWSIGKLGWYERKVKDVFGRWEHWYYFIGWEQKDLQPRELFTY